MASHSQIAHLWANKADKRGGRSGSLFSNGDTIYSYGYHFAIATHVANDAGLPAVLFTERDYSNSTAKHKSHVRNALYGSNLPVFYVTNVDREVNWAEEFASKENYARELVVRAKRARTYGPMHLEHAKRTLAEMQRTKDFFHLTLTVPTFEDIGPDSEATKAIEERARIAREEQRESDRIQAERRKQYEAEQRAKDANHFSLWREGGAVQCPYSFAEDANGSAYLRTIGDVVQTSRGAEVPLSHAIKAFRFVKLCRTTGQPFIPNGHTVHIGHFNVRSITAEGNAQIGCHFLTWERISEWATATGIANAEVSTEALQVTEGAK